MLAITRGHAPDIIFAMRVVTQGGQHCSFAVDFAYLRIERHRAFKIDKLIDHELTAQGAVDAIKGNAPLLPRLNTFAVLIPKIFW